MCQVYDSLEELTEEEALEVVRSKGSARPAVALRPRAVAAA
ncbi:MAG: hypothetical protein QXO51_05775 [Halobacteria archaeon]